MLQLPCTASVTVARKALRVICAMVTAVYCVAAQVNSNNDGTAGVKTIDMGIAPEAEWKLQDVAEFAAGVRCRI
jgi:hypothetical protein